VFDGDYVLRRSRPVYACPLESLGLMRPRGKQSTMETLTPRMSVGFEDS
jgi:hypothetical protein